MEMTHFHQEGNVMQKKCVPYGSDVSAGEFECADCGKRIKMGSKTSLPPCSNINGGLAEMLRHTKKCWIVLSGQGDAPQDPYPKK